MKLLSLAGLLALATSAHAQTNLPAASAAIRREGLELYYLERAAWLSTDLLVASRYPPQLIDSYFSYAHGDSIRTLFVGGGAGPAVLAEYRCPRARLRAAASRRRGPRPLLPQERMLLTIRQQALTDLHRLMRATLPARTAFNPVLLPKGNQVWVYVLTGPTADAPRGTTLLGNDYLLRYQATGRLLGCEKLHPALIPIERGAASPTLQASLHLHRPGSPPYITPSDVCTLLLYHDQLPGRTHLVFSKKYVSIFSPPDSGLLILTRRQFLARTRNTGPGVVGKAR